MAMEAKRIINGTWGEVWLDGDKVAECFGLTAKVEFQKEEVKIAGQFATDTKVVGYKGTGTLKLHKVNSRLAVKLEAMVKEGQDLRFTVITKLHDPDSYGAERVAIKGVSFDDLTLQDWEAGTPAQTEAPFTFLDYDFLDQIA